MVKIFDSIYLNNGQKIVLDLKNITPKGYTEKYRRKLFCSTEGCNAKLSFVAKSGNRSYLRTWRYNLHSKHCPHFLDKEEGETVSRRTNVQIGVVYGDQMNRSQKEAFELEVLSEEERVKRLENKSRQRNNRNKRLRRRSTSEQLTIHMILDPSKLTEDSPKIKARLYKRNVDTLKKSDLGQARTLIGRIQSVESSERNVIVRIFKNDTYMNVKFEKAFFASAPTYINLFPYIQRFSEENDSVIFCATGEVRNSMENDEFELIVFNKEGLLIHGMTLPSIVSSYTTQQLSF
ncbi:hypothetical protein MHH81_01505 [Psychrobacillus sp. FSL H8-0484]|uniref:hypothetical protein n=1 Tax=Psychrobacillus sp. FSL H8-0484 TaxID=2921390 RepID=UPI0030FAA748